MRQLTCILILLFSSLAFGRLTEEGQQGKSSAKDSRLAIEFSPEQQKDFLRCLEMLQNRPRSQFATGNPFDTCLELMVAPKGNAKLDAKDVRSLLEKFLRSATRGSQRKILERALREIETGSARPREESPVTEGSANR